MQKFLYKTVVILFRTFLIILGTVLLFFTFIYLDSCSSITGINNNYEDEEKIEEIIGMELPQFTIENSQTTHLQAFDAESSNNVVLKFKTLPDKQFFNTLDSICKLEVPDTVEENSKIFAAGLESYYNVWSKDSNQYKFSIIGDHLKRTLHKEDAFFMLTIKENSLYAELKYGNF